MSREAIIFDIDGTLADCSHRLHHIQGGKRDWPAFFGAMGEDAPVAPIRRLLSICSMTLPIILCSGRPDDYRKATEDWLEHHGISYAALYMRTAGDHREDSIVKSRLLDGIRADGFEPVFVIDDRPRVVAMWRERGLTCLQCREWTDEEPAPRALGLLTLMVGPSGAGKSLFLRTLEAAELGISFEQIISSDALRWEICGDFRDQSENLRVWKAAHDMIRARISNGLPAVLDATNLKRKDRIAAVTFSVMNGGPIRYIVVNRPMEERRRDADWRPLELLTKHDQAFRSQERGIMAGDDLPNVTVVDHRRAA